MANLGVLSVAVFLALMGATHADVFNSVMHPHSYALDLIGYLSNPQLFKEWIVRSGRARNTEDDQIPDLLVDNLIDVEIDDKTKQRLTPKYTLPTSILSQFATDNAVELKDIRTYFTTHVRLFKATKARVVDIPKIVVNAELTTKPPPTKEVPLENVIIRAVVFKLYFKKGDYHHVAHLLTTYVGVREVAVLQIGTDEDENKIVANKLDLDVNVIPLLPLPEPSNADAAAKTAAKAGAAPGSV